MSEALALEHRRALSRLTDLSVRDLRRLLTVVAGADAVLVRDALLEALPPLADSYSDMAAALAADYYDEAREQAEVRGRFRAEPAPLPGAARYEALVRWGVDPLFGRQDRAAALGRLAGGLQRVVADASRETIVRSAVRDPQAAGWQRVTDGNACKFCRMLADRGAVYREATVRFASHDDCGCTAAPAFDPGRSVQVNAYRASKRQPSEADRARVREYLARNP